jgi:hypothetical protein
VASNGALTLGIALAAAVMARASPPSSGLARDALAQSVDGRTLGD